MSIIWGCILAICLYSMAFCQDDGKDPVKKPTFYYRVVGQREDVSIEGTATEADIAIVREYGCQKSNQLIIAKADAALAALKRKQRRKAH